MTFDLAVALDGLVSAIAAGGTIYAMVRSRRSARREELHDGLTLWLRNSGGDEIRSIVREEVAPVVTRLELHEATEPERFYDYVRKEREDG